MSSAAAQLDFAGIESGWEILTVDEDRKAGKFTAALLDKNAEKRDAVIEALAQGMSIRRIASAFGLSVNTVLTAKRKFGDKIETDKQRLGRMCFEVAHLAIERMRDEIQDMPRASLPIVAGVMTDKGLLLTGAPTVRVEHTHGPTVLDVADYIASLPTAIPVGKGENLLQKGAVIEVGQGAFLPAGDNESPVSMPLPEGDQKDGQTSGQIDPQKGTP